MNFIQSLIRCKAPWACVALALTCAASVAHAASPEKEAEYLGVLKSDAPKSEKAITCKYLAIYGSSQSVEELAKLLSDEQLSSWARIPLEAIPGPEADAALVEATKKLSGRLLIGVINSIGVRRVANSTGELKSLLASQDADVATAAAVALGHVGGDAAAKILREALATAPENVISGVAEGCVLCAEQYLAQDKSAEATSLYDLVRAAKVPQQRMLEATRGAILARKEKGVTLLLEQLRSPSIPLFQIGLSTAREFPGKDVDQSLADEVAKATPDRGALIIHAMADRPKTIVLTAVIKSAKTGPKEVRLAAIEALGRVGNNSCLTTLLDVAQDKDEELVEAAKKSLAELPGDDVDKEILNRLKKPDPKVYATLLELVGLRLIEATSDLQKALDHSDKGIRAAALTSLGATVPPDKLSILIKQVVSPKSPDDEPIAQAALMTASVRMADREACATELDAALDKAPISKKIVILKILASVGGTKSVQTIGTLAKSNDPQLQDACTDLLGKWMTADAAPYLLDLAKGSSNFQDRTMKGYVRIVKYAPTEAERIEMCLKAFEACKQVSQQKLVLNILKQNPSIETMKLAIQCVQSPDLKDDAIQSVLAIAQKLGNNAEARELLTKVELNKIKLEIIKAEYGSGSSQKDVTEIVQKNAGDTPYVTLPSTSYNEAFGGDPAPNSPKKLRIVYRMNERAGEASFTEDALIVLPTPKQ